MKAKFIKIQAVLIAVIMCFCAVCVNAAEVITIDSVVCEKYTDEYGYEDDTLLAVNVSITAPETTNEITIVVSSTEIEEVNAETISQVIYMNQIDVPEDGICVINIEKSKIKSVLGVEAIEGATLYLKVGGATAEEMAKTTFTCTVAEEAITFGDVNSDGYVDAGDAVLILRNSIGLNELTEAQVKAADVNMDGDVNYMDAISVLQYDAGIIDSVN